MARIEQWAINNNLIPDAQFSSGKNHSAVDCIFILKTRIDVRFKNNVCTLVLLICVKAFDRVRQNCLWRMLEKLRLSKRMRNTLQTIYKHATGMVKGDGQLSDPIPTRNGVRQGCPLSPLLFSLFISDIPKLLKEGGCTGGTLSTSQINSLLLADDLVIKADSREELQQVLNMLSDYSGKFGLQVNESKTKVMVFSITASHLYQIINELKP